MALQHLRSSTADKRPLPAGMSDGQLAINTNATSPGLFLKNSTGGLVKVGPVHVGTTAPNVSPAAGGDTGNTTGELWLDTSLTPNELKTWNGSAWVSALGQEIPVSKLADGAAYQVLQTDSAGTGVEWTSSLALPGTLSVTGQTTLIEIKETVYSLSGTAIDPANGSIQSKTFGANTTFTESLEAGQTVVLMLEGGATYTVTWPTITWVTGAGNAAPTLTAKDTLVLWKVSTTLYGAYVGSYV